MDLRIQRNAWDKIMAYTTLCPTEISGLGKVSNVDGELVVNDVAIFEQRASGAHSTITTEALAKFQTERVLAGESMKEWCFWWHSHANMGVFFSKTDTDTIEGSTEFPWLVSLVVNKKHEHKARLDVFVPINLFIELEVKILEVPNEEVKAICQKEIDEKILPSYLGTTHHRKGSWKGWNPRDRDDERMYSMGFGDRENFGSRTQSEEMKEERVEYWAHKAFLQTQIQALLKKPNKHKILLKRQEELEEHIVWGRSQGHEITQVKDLLPQTTGGKQTSSTQTGSQIFS